MGFIVRASPGGHDEYGDPVAGTTQRIPVTPLGVAPRMSEESNARGRDGVVVGLTVYLPAGTDIHYTDQYEDDSGVVHDVLGEPGVWSNPFTGLAAGIQVALKRAEG